MCKQTCFRVVLCECVPQDPSNILCHRINYPWSGFSSPKARIFRRNTTGVCLVCAFMSRNLRVNFLYTFLGTEDTQITFLCPHTKLFSICAFFFRTQTNRSHFHHSNILLALHIVSSASLAQEIKPSTDKFQHCAWKYKSKYSSVLLFALIKFKKPLVACERCASHHSKLYFHLQSKSSRSLIVRERFKSRLILL